MKCPFSAVLATDWMVYVVAVNHLGFYYLAVQLTNVVVFSVAKYLFAERVFQSGGSRPFAAR